MNGFERRLEDETKMTFIMLARDPAEMLQRARVHVTDWPTRGWSDWFAWSILLKAEEFERVINPRQLDAAVDALNR
jgi:hypothetical protein